jgi:hypothetical protein
VGWFLHVKAEFTLGHLPANSYVCYIHVVRALPSDVLTTVRDLTRLVTAATPKPDLLKQSLLARFTSSPLQQCFRMLDMPSLGDRRPSAMFAEMQALRPEDANVLFHAIFLRRLPEAIRNALIDRRKIEPRELAAAADLLLHTTPATVAAAAPERFTPTAAPTPVPVAAALPPAVPVAHSPQTTRYTSAAIITPPSSPATIPTTSFFAPVLLPLQFRAIHQQVPTTLPLAGKPVVAPAVSLVKPAPPGASLIYLKDCFTHITYLVDTGAALSLIPHRSPLPSSGPSIVNANGDAIPSWQFVSKNLRFGSNNFVHYFPQENISQPIIGMDFWSLHSLTIDVSRGEVPSSYLSLPLPIPAPHSFLSCNSSHGFFKDCFPKPLPACRTSSFSSYSFLLKHPNPLLPGPSPNTPLLITFTPQACH